MPRPMWRRLKVGAASRLAQAIEFRGAVDDLEDILISAFDERDGGDWLPRVGGHGG